MMRVLTVRQPWATLIVTGHKPVENRTWRTDYRGDVAILAGRAIDLDDRAVEAYIKFLAPGADRQDVAAEIASLPRGGVIGVGEIWGETRTMDSWFFTGPCGLLLRDFRVCRPLVPLRGSLCLQSICEPVERQIRHAAAAG